MWAKIYHHPLAGETSWAPTPAMKIYSFFQITVQSCFHYLLINYIFKELFHYKIIKATRLKRDKLSILSSLDSQKWIISQLDSFLTTQLAVASQIQVGFLPHFYYLCIHPYTLVYKWVSLMFKYINPINHYQQLYVGQSFPCDKIRSESVLRFRKA